MASPLLRVPKIHLLKCVNPYYTNTANGYKTAEYRSTIDREFCEGDLMVLREYINPNSETDNPNCATLDGYTGRISCCFITDVCCHETMPDSTAILSHGTVRNFIECYSEGQINNAIKHIVDFFNELSREPLVWGDAHG